MTQMSTEPPWPSLITDDLADISKNHSTSGSAGHGGGKEPGEHLKEWSSLIGIITAIVGNVLIALALNVQRYAHIRLHKERHRIRRRAREAQKRAKTGAQAGTYGTLEEENGSNEHNGNGNASLAVRRGGYDEESRESDPLMESYHSGVSNDSECDEEQDKVASTYLKSPYWWLGQVLITLGEMGNFLAYGFAPASIVSPIGVVALISNCIIAPAMFHEKFRGRDFWGVVIAVGGVATVVLSANQEEGKLNPHDVWDAITSTPFEIYMAVTISLIIVLMWASGRYGGRTILIDLGLVGLFGGYTALATKGVSSMLSSTLWRAFTTPVTYALVVILLGTAVMQIRYVNKALQRFDSTQVIPIQFVMFTLCVILGSAVLYRDFERTTAEQAAKFVGGCLLTFFGVFLITSGRTQSHSDDDDDDDDDMLSDTEGVEETFGLASQDGVAASSGHPHNGQDAPTPRSQSRRSSKLSQLSYAETIKTLTPQHDFYVPSVRVLGPQSPDQETPINNAWPDVGGPSTPPGRGVRAYSTDSVLGGCAVASASNPTTPLRDSNVPPIYPTDGSVVAVTRPGLSPTKPGSHHRSRTFISPSPLSSTVTAVVKDAFLRAKDDPGMNQSSIRRIRSSIRASLFFNEDDDIPGQAQGVVPASDNMADAFGEPEEGTTDADQVRRRSRSMSDTLGDFFGVRRKKRRDEYSVLAGDVEAGGAATHPNLDNNDNRHEEH